MAGEPAAPSRLARLRREIDVDLVALDARSAEVEELLVRWRDAGALPRAELVLVAVNLHGWYTALETLLERVSRLLDDDVPSGPTWHTDLIEQMQVDVPGVRAAVVPQVANSELHELRKFRHFFRNAYLLELDPGRIREHADRLVRAHLVVRPAIAALRAQVDAMLASAAV